MCIRCTSPARMAVRVADMDQAGVSSGRDPADVGGARERRWPRQPLPPLTRSSPPHTRSSKQVLHGRCSVVGVDGRGLRGSFAEHREQHLVPSGMASCFAAVAQGRLQPSPRRAGPSAADNAAAVTVVYAAVNIAQYIAGIRAAQRPRRRAARSPPFHWQRTRRDQVSVSSSLRVCMDGGSVDCDPV